MEPKQTGFPFPVLDFFKPRKVDDILGVKYEASFAKVVFKHNDECPENHCQDILLPRDSVESAYVNDLGGISLGFSKKVVYYGNGCGNVLLTIEGYDEYDRPIGFGYDGVARVRKVDKIVVWENADVPEKKKALRTR